MTENTASQGVITATNNRRLSVTVFSLFFAWLLAFPFEGRILYALADYYNTSPQSFIGESDDWYDPDKLHGESYATLLTFSVPPEVLRGGETVSLRFSLSFTDNNLSFFDGSGSARRLGECKIQKYGRKKFF